jgi:hypothetical protein
MTNTTLATLIHGAIAGFASCDWTHNNGRDESGEPNYCSGGNPDTCETCREANQDARTAQVHGFSASLALVRGDFEKVLDHVRSARDLERKWGDAPAWGPAFRGAEIADAIQRANALSAKIDDAAERPEQDLAAFAELTSWIAEQIGSDEMIDSVVAPEAW